MDLSVCEVLAGTTVLDMVKAFQDEDHCRHLLEAMGWPKERIGPACGHRRSIALASREKGKRAPLGKSGLRQAGSAVRQLATCLLERFGLVEAVVGKVHHPAGLAHVAERLCQLERQRSLACRPRSTR